MAGDANPDLVLRGDVVPRFGQAEQLLDAADLVLGGSAGIVACGLARLGVPTTFAARVGADVFGTFTLAALRAAGVDTSAVEVDPRIPTGMSVILSTPGDRAILTVPGTIPTLRGDQVLAAVTAATTHLHVASYFLQPGLAADLPGVLAAARARGLTTSLDTNWDPAGSWHGLTEVLAHVDVLLPNLEELRALAMSLGASVGTSDQDAARRLAGLGPRVVVKAGAAGGWSAGADGDVVRHSGLTVEVVDTTGAGDSFDAGYLAAMAHGVTDERERLRWATTAGSLSTLGPGGTGRQATLDDVVPAS